MASLNIVPLGSPGEIGKNMTSIEYGRNIPIVDAGIMFPENDRAGFELARAIRQHRGHLKDVPILMLTSINRKFPMGFN